MSCEIRKLGGLDYALCRYGASKLQFRGPPQKTSVPYVAFMGGAKTFGRYIALPFPALVERQVALPCLNLGTPSAGVDVFLRDDEIMRLASAAQVTVVQVTGAHNMTNRYYSVHPRRNDRFIAPSKLLCSIYPEVDFAEFHFTRHLLNALWTVSNTRFELVVNELQEAWVARMRLLIGRMTGPSVLLWLNAHDEVSTSDPTIGSAPLFVTQRMIAQVETMAAKLIQVSPSRRAVSEGTTGMVFPKEEKKQAAQLAGVRAHREIADVLGPTIRRLA
ncbi:DUF6473 family protein [Sulfitobacter sp. BSw21498]|uniref:DUF6473 family protein n=1 Tax=Sulfitobacter sp. BSw21498 TaxID=664426 RepID=UPI0020C7A586|nr:DUF6473 family protein [Sulfitobacter sp. BSw21498]